MDVFLPLIHALYEAPFSTAIRESEWTFPVIQTFHILGILLFYGGIALVDLRIIGVVLKRLATRDVAAALLPLAWVGFGVMAISGGLLFAAQAEKIYSNVYLLAKFALIGLAGLNLAAFSATSGRTLATWGGSKTGGGAGGGAPASAKISAGVSFVLWTFVVVAGRFIAYFQAA